MHPFAGAAASTDNFEMTRGVWIIALAAVATAGCATTAPVTAVVAPHPPPDRSFVIPAIEIVSMNAAMNLAGRQTRFAADLQVSLQSIRRNLTTRWVIDHDPFAINQLLHPYQGGTYHGIGRSSGLNYWQSTVYTIAGSALWEVAGERTLPSRNDQITTSLSGPFLGEALFRFGHLLRHPRGRPPAWWQRLGAVVVSPPLGLNHAIFGHRFDDPNDLSSASTNVRFDIGATRPIDRRLTAWTPSGSVAVDYALPGAEGRDLVRPFDDFRVEGRGSSAGIDAVSVRGVVTGRRYGTGRSIWGVFGNYEYFVPENFHLSNAGAMFGAATTWQSPSLTIGAIAAGGAGYVATQSRTVPVAAPTTYEVAPQAVFHLRAIGGRRWSFDATGRGYFVNDMRLAPGKHRDVIYLIDAGIAARLFRGHGIALKYVGARTHPATIGIFYTWFAGDPTVVR